MHACDQFQAGAGRRRKLDGRGSEKPILGNIRARHLTTAGLALLCAPVDDELPRAALRITDREGDMKTFWKGYSPRTRSSASASHRASERKCAMNDSRRCTCGPSSASRARMAPKSASRSSATRRGAAVRPVAATLRSRRASRGR